MAPPPSTTVAAPARSRSDPEILSPRQRAQLNEYPRYPSKKKLSADFSDGTYSGDSGLESPKSEKNWRIYSAVDGPYLTGPLAQDYRSDREHFLSPRGKRKDLTNLDDLNLLFPPLPTCVGPDLDQLDPVETITSESLCAQPQPATEEPCPSYGYQDSYDPSLSSPELPALDTQATPEPYTGDDAYVSTGEMTSTYPEYADTNGMSYEGYQAPLQSDMNATPAECGTEHSASAECYDAQDTYEYQYGSYQPDEYQGGNESYHQEYYNEESITDQRSVDQVPESSYSYSQQDYPPLKSTESAAPEQLTNNAVPSEMEITKASVSSPSRRRARAPSYAEVVVGQSTGSAEQCSDLAIAKQGSSHDMFDRVADGIAESMKGMMFRTEKGRSHSEVELSCLIQKVQTQMKIMGRASLEIRDQFRRNAYELAKVKSEKRMLEKMVEQLEGQLEIHQNEQRQFQDEMMTSQRQQTDLIRSSTERIDRRIQEHQHLFQELRATLSAELSQIRAEIKSGANVDQQFDKLTEAVEAILQDFMKTVANGEAPDLSKTSIKDHLKSTSDISKSGCVVEKTSGSSSWKSSALMGAMLWVASLGGVYYAAKDTPHIVSQIPQSLTADQVEMMLGRMGNSLQQDLQVSILTGTQDLLERQKRDQSVQPKADIELAVDEVNKVQTTMKVEVVQENTEVNVRNADESNAALAELVVPDWLADATPETEHEVEGVDNTDEIPASSLPAESVSVVSEDARDLSGLDANIDGVLSENIGSKSTLSSVEISASTESNVEIHVELKHGVELQGSSELESTTLEEPTSTPEWIDGAESASVPQSFHNDESISVTETQRHGEAIEAHSWTGHENAILVDAQGDEIASVLEQGDEADADVEDSSMETGISVLEAEPEQTAASVDDQVDPTSEVEDSMAEEDELRSLVSMLNTKKKVKTSPSAEPVSSTPLTSLAAALSSLAGGKEVGTHGFSKRNLLEDSYVLANVLYDEFSGDFVEHSAPVSTVMDAIFDLDDDFKSNSSEVVAEQPIGRMDPIESIQHSDEVDEMSQPELPNVSPLSAQPIEPLGSAIDTDSSVVEAVAEVEEDAQQEKVISAPACPTYELLLVNAERKAWEAPLTPEESAVSETNEDIPTEPTKTEAPVASSPLKPALFYRLQSFMSQCSLIDDLVSSTPERSVIPAPKSTPSRPIARNDLFAGQCFSDKSGLLHEDLQNPVEAEVVVEDVSAPAYAHGKFSKSPVCAVVDELISLSKPCPAFPSSTSAKEVIPPSSSRVAPDALSYPCPAVTNPFEQPFCTSSSA